MKFDRMNMVEALRRVVQRMHYPLEVMLVCVRWYAAYPLSFRNIEEMMAERGVFVDHSTLHRGSIKVLPLLVAVFRQRKRPVGRSWRMDETYVKVDGQWKYRFCRNSEMSPSMAARPTPIRKSTSKFGRCRRIEEPASTIRRAPGQRSQKFRRPKRHELGELHAHRGHLVAITADSEGNAKRPLADERPEHFEVGARG